MCFDQLLVVHSTQKLVKIHNTIYQLLRTHPYKSLPIKIYKAIYKKILVCVLTRFWEHLKAGQNTQHPESRPHNLQTIMNNHNKKHVFIFMPIEMLIFLNTKEIRKKVNKCVVKCLFTYRSK